MKMGVTIAYRHGEHLRCVPEVNMQSGHQPADADCKQPHSQHVDGEEHQHDADVV